MKFDEPSAFLDPAAVSQACRTSLQCRRALPCEQATLASYTPFHRLPRAPTCTLLCAFFNTTLGFFADPSEVRGTRTKCFPNRSYPRSATPQGTVHDTSTFHLPKRHRPAQPVEISRTSCPSPLRSRARDAILGSLPRQQTSAKVRPRVPELVEVRRCRPLIPRRVVPVVLTPWLVRRQQRIRTTPRSHHKPRRHKSPNKNQNNRAGAAAGTSIGTSVGTAADGQHVHEQKQVYRPLRQTAHRGERRWIEVGPCGPTRTCSKFRYELCLKQVHRKSAHPLPGTPHPRPPRPHGARATG